MPKEEEFTHIIRENEGLIFEITDLLIYVPLAIIFFAFFTSFVYRNYKGVMN
jgi:hypothetical protein